MKRMQKEGTHAKRQRRRACKSNVLILVAAGKMRWAWSRQITGPSLPAKSHEHAETHGHRFRLRLQTSATHPQIWGARIHHFKMHFKDSPPANQHCHDRFTSGCACCAGALNDHIPTHAATGTMNADHDIKQHWQGTRLGGGIEI